MAMFYLLSAILLHTAAAKSAPPMPEKDLRWGKNAVSPAMAAILLHMAAGKVYALHIP